MSSQDRSRQPNILLVMTDQLRYPPRYESDEVRAFRREQFTGEESLRTSGISFLRHYTMAAACAPSLFLDWALPIAAWCYADGWAGEKSADSADMFWLAPDTVPTLGDWFRAGGDRTFYKGTWHVSHPHSVTRTARASSSRSRTTGRRSQRTSLRRQVHGQDAARGRRRRRRREGRRRHYAGRWLSHRPLQGAGKDRRSRRRIAQVNTAPATRRSRSALRRLEEAAIQAVRGARHAKRDEGHLERRQGRAQRASRPPRHWPPRRALLLADGGARPAAPPRFPSRRPRNRAAEPRGRSRRAAP